MQSGGTQILDTQTFLVFRTITGPTRRNSNNLSPWSFLSFRVISVTTESVFLSQGTAIPSVVPLDFNRMTWIFPQCLSVLLLEGLYLTGRPWICLTESLPSVVPLDFNRMTWICPLCPSGLRLQGLYLTGRPWICLTETLLRHVKYTGAFGVLAGILLVNDRCQH
jgi:hypothetical protein